MSFVGFIVMNGCTFTGAEMLVNQIYMLVMQDYRFVNNSMLSQFGGDREVVGIINTFLTINSCYYFPFLRTLPIAVLLPLYS